jgi:hypothetical protein
MMKTVAHRFSVGKVVISPEFVRMEKVYPDIEAGVLVIEAVLPLYDHRPQPFIEACLYEEEKNCLTDLLKTINRQANVDVVRIDGDYGHVNLYPYISDGGVKEPTALLAALLVGDSSENSNNLYPILSDNAFFTLCQPSDLQQELWEMVTVTAHSRPIVLHSPNGSDKEWLHVGARVSRVGRQGLINLGFREALED